MFDFTQDKPIDNNTVLLEQGYWPALAQKEFQAGRYSKVVELCREHISGGCRLLSGRLLYARALFHAGQIDSSLEQLFYVLACDADNISALKYLGDCKFAQGDELGALNCYQKVSSLDPGGSQLALAYRPAEKTVEHTKTVTLKRVQPEHKKPPTTEPLRRIPFVTETMGDLYIQQGHFRLAREVFATLVEQSDSGRLREKLSNAELRIKEKDATHVKKKD